MKKSVASTRKAKILAKRLLRIHKDLPSWRKIAQDYPGVSFATLNRIAKSKGEWVPKSVHLQELLGLIRKPHEKNLVPLSDCQRWWRGLPKADRDQMIRNLFELEGPHVSK